MSPELPSSLASIKLANPGSPGKMAVKIGREGATERLAVKQKVAIDLYS